MPLTQTGVIMSRKDYRKDIQVLRGISVTLVVFYHFQIPGFKNGFLGVDIFYVISGYLMAQLYKPEKRYLFFSRRAKRLLPAYFMTLFLTILFSYYILIPSDFRQLIDQIKASLYFIPNIYFWNQNSYFTSTEFNPLLNLWSLGVEFQFYLAIPLISYIFIKNRKLLVIVLLTSILASFFILTISPKTSFFLLPLRLWEFLFGFLTYNLNQRFTLNSRIKLGLITYIVIISFSVIFFPVRVYSTSAVFGHPALLSVLVVVATSLFIGLQLSIKTTYINRLFEKIGDYSYSIYLAHFPVIVLYNYKPFSGTIIGVKDLKGLIITTLLILILVIFSYKFIELPFRKLNYDIRFLTLPLVFLYIFSNISIALQEAHFTPQQVQISNAFRDRSFYRCGKMFRILNPTKPICPLFKGNSSTKVLLLGNSHADSIKTTFIHVSRDFNTSAFFWAQNDPLMDGGSSIEDIYKEITRLNITDVFIHYSGAAVSPQTIKDFTNKLINNNISVNIISPVPVWSEKIPYLMWNRNYNKQELDQDYSDYLFYNHDELDFLKTFVNPKFSYLNSGAIFCEDLCKYENETGIPYYWDSNHLTLTGADLYKSSLDDMFKKITTN
jgi:peptidoglycan/LPS O-acetylase OafA/YrhL